MKKQRIIMAAAVLGSATIGLAGTAMASAQTKSVTAHATHRHVRIEARLNQAVRDGTITSSQETALKSELKTLRSERKSALNKQSTKTERQAERTKLKGELQSWAGTNGFPLSKIFPKLSA